jgi:hypothetical protein
MKPGKLFQLFANTWTCSSRWWINDGTTSPKGQVFVAKLKIAEENLEIAATEEDFDRAAWLQEANESLASAGGAIDLPEYVLSSTVSGDGESEYDGVADYDPPVEAEESAKDEEEKEILLRRVLTMMLL